MIMLLNRTLIIRYLQRYIRVRFKLSSLTYYTLIFVLKINNFESTKRSVMTHSIQSTANICIYQLTSPEMLETMQTY